MKRAFAAFLLLGVGSSALAQGSSPATVRPYLWSAERPSSQVGEINVFRRFSSDRTAEMREFYGEALGLTVLPDTAAGGVLTFFYADQTALTQRFTARGLPAPKFGAQTSHAGATAAALVQDPDGEWVELVVVRGPRARRERRSPAIAAGSNADAVARGPGRREQLFRAVRRQRQQPAAP